MTRILRLAIPNKGRLRETTASLLSDAGLDFEQSDRTLSVSVRNVDLDLLFVRTEDIAELVADGTADLGITGQDLLAEDGKNLPVLAELGFGHCRLVAAVPKASAAEKLEDLNGLRVATAHPNATRRIFDDRGIEAEIVTLRGSVEVAPKLGVADAIVDLVSTGSTMLVNGLRQIDTILTSQAVLVGSPAALATRSAETDTVVTALTAVTQGRRKRYLLLNAPASSVSRIQQIIPGLGAPTVVPLADNQMVAVHSVVDAGSIWNLLPDLKAAGARDILVLRIEQLIP
ncbi:MAG: ATP phosphoribosyltransferase [Acidimicrobiia bacterium]|nr:ATP phosphoribosyltransferase [Acidimicrobiia bacterium]